MTDELPESYIGDCLRCGREQVRHKRIKGTTLYKCIACGHEVIIPTTTPEEK